MKIHDFDFNLPHELIAQYPPVQRDSSRLLCLNRKTGAVEHHHFRELPDLLLPHDLLVFNDTRVIPARLYGEKQTGGKVEVLIERLLHDHCVLAHVRASKSPRVGSRLRFAEGIGAEVIGRADDLFELQFLGERPVSEILDTIGHVPLPPYIERHDENVDRERYQTIFAKVQGAVAAPTAGLHFDGALMDRLDERRIGRAFITLHVGAGTFQPVRVEIITEHKMHAEFACVSESVCERIRETKRRGGRVIAVGTTCVRSLEAASQSGECQPLCGDTDIFIYPGYSFKCVDAMITNFHLPKSTLLMLVSAFAGRENILNAYQEAIRERYRFFSYGDAMLISSI